MLGKFAQMKRWNENAEVCEVIEGRKDEPGCVRYCAGGGRAPDGSPLRWVKEKLLTLSANERRMTYCMLDLIAAMPLRVTKLPYASHQ
ncbi:hypothetical protein KP509_39G050700 [Ceratopteris richardii]|uniref:Uncharacterized protein n=1 Tax=Ceratopteris richardii TaxID=49495 RepID=A0A8T2Q1W1_CERRI|nr:hypothetical protein KP509_39G050700 [Ceratopteris richardii]